MAEKEKSNKDELKEEKSEEEKNGEESQEKVSDDEVTGKDGNDKESESEGKSKEADNTDKTVEAGDEDEALNSKYLRLMADFQNYKRRAENDKSASYAFGKEEVVNQLLPVIDNFERALEHDDDGAGPFKAGMEMIFKQMMDVLKSAGLEEIEALGEEFDPNVHSAMMTEDSEEYESNHVTDVLQKGYKLKDKVIRPSMVKVAN